MSQIKQDWQPMSSAPKNATWVEVQLPTGSIVRAHFAEDYSGEFQPAFEGWFVEGPIRQPGDPKWKGGFIEIDNPVKWRPIKEESK